MPDRTFRDFLAQPLGRRALLRNAALVSAGGAAIYAIGCGGSKKSDATPDDAAGSTPTGLMPEATPTANPSGITPMMLTQEFVAGENNRFAVGLLDQSGKLVKNAKVHLRFFTITADNAGLFRGEGDATFVELNVEGAHVHDQSTGGAVADESVAFYAATTPFDEAGRWGVELTVTPDDGRPQAKIAVPFEVRQTSQSPGVGTMPPASLNDTFATNSNIESLCSRSPACPLHDKVIADVLGKGRPLVVQFSTPAFCQTRFCGPVLEVLLQQVPAYQDRVDFVHIEVWQDFQLQKQRPVVDEWHLPGEPYTFFMDGDGKVVGRLEAIFSDEELRSALVQLVKL
jgi:hypothetical protein